MPRAMKRPRRSPLTGAGAAVVTGALLASACSTTLPPPGSTAVASGPSEVEIGYGTQAAEEVTGAVASIRVDEMDREITSFEDLFQGVAGVTVRRLSNGGISVRVRGSSSLSSDAEPLFVINGVPIRAAPGQALMGVNPRDVTRVDVLKDAGATSIYGSRGANGVILIFTTPREAPALQRPTAPAHAGAADPPSPEYSGGSWRPAAISLPVHSMER
ncbi:TonB-dependent receptor plug domain-containing protein [Gaopeijia maritima]|uniref:TonB-dependent receptor plug domain-containing protein n=1 Tax=Gaopeijia maritima TaxID=3119007 RepID=A0ABU9E5M9_9BACT